MTSIDLTTIDRHGIPTEPAEASVTPVAAAWLGVRAMAPAATGLLPFAVSIGVAIAISPLDDLTGFATGPLLFGGSPQVATIALLGARASVLTVLGTVVALTARLALYGAALAPTLRDQPAWFRVLAPYFLVDPLVATVGDFMARPLHPSVRRAFYLGAAATLYLSWLAGMVVGIVAVPRLDPSWSLDLAAPLCLVALLGRRLAQPHAPLPVAVAALVAVAGWLAGAAVGPVTLTATLAGAAAGSVRGRAGSVRGRAGSVRGRAGAITSKGVEMSAGIVLGLAGIVTFGIRSSLVHVLHGRSVGERMSRALTAAVAGGLAASAAAAALPRLGDHGVAHAAAVAITLLAARSTKGLLIPVALGMAVSIAVVAAGA